MADIRIAWWNVENLFDAATASRDPALAKTLKSELTGWTAAIRDAKIAQLASVIRQMFGGSGPDLLGVCEVENENVLKLLAQKMALPGRDYAVVSHDSHDARGIDVGFIIDRNVVRAENTGHQVVVKRTATRDIFWMDTVVRETGDVFVAIGNHWPSRTAGTYESEPFRILTGETLSVVIQELFDEFDVGEKLPVVAMGDFNDEPFNRSIQEYALATRDPGRVRYARTPRLLNLMWPLMQGEDPGTYLYSSEWNMLDQFMVSKGVVLKNTPFNVKPGSVQIFRPDSMIAAGGAPRRFGRPQKGLDQGGFSDHFPITMILSN